ncbi:exportin-1 [Nematocida minor]|uniref:exportin-1 n=1 Tax=Nematocida minor TaxID=1912983 RepID=UPI00221F18D1|nr:exportin-1 [Nematocida minor]KAI5191445.1 exportin-1 [Nematocida minor]
MEKLLEATDQFDVELFDSVIRAFYSPGDREHKRAESVLLQFREHPDSWARTADVIKESKDSRSKIFAVQALERAVKVRWSMLTEEQQKGAREYVVDKILELSMASTPEAKVLVKQFNQVLIEVIKREWPSKWPTLITDLLEASRGDCGICANSFNLLALLCDGIFNFHESLVSERVAALQSQMKNEFHAIYEIVTDILDKVSTGEIAVPNDLVLSSLNLLRILVPFFSSEYLFQYKLVEIVSRYIESEFIVPAVQVLRGILARADDASSTALFMESLKRCFVVISAFFEKYCHKFNQMHTEGMHAHYDSFLQQDVNLIREIVLFYGLAYKYAREMEKMHCNTKVPLGLMLEISKISDFELFRLCLEFWSMFVKELFLEFPFVPASTKSPAGLRRVHYAEEMSALVPVLVAQMQRPEEVIIAENEDNEIVLEKLVDTECIQHHKEMNELLYNISAMTPGGLGPYFCSEISKLRSGPWTRERLNKVSWAAGSIAGTSTVIAEKEFLTQAIQTLLSMCEEATEEGNRAVVASCLMYILVRNPAYLKTYPLLLEAICNKMLQFIIDVDLVGVPEMACDTLLKLMSSCAEVLRIPLSPDRECYVTSVFPQIPKILSVLKPYLSEVLFEALSYLCCDYVDKLLQQPLMDLFTPGVDTAEGVLRIVHAVRLVKVVCSVNVSEEFFAAREIVIGRALGQLQNIYSSLPTASVHPPMLNRNIQILRKEIVILYEIIAKEFSVEFILGSFIEVCAGVILPPVRAGLVSPVETLDLLAELCKRTVEGTAPLVNEVAAPVAQYVWADPDEKEEHMKAFYRMLCAAVRSNPVMNSLQKIEWLALGAGHANREIYEESIEVLAKVIERSPIEIIRDAFLGLLECILGTALDKDHEGGMSSLLVSLSLLVKYSIEEKCPTQNQVLEVFGSKLHGIFPHINPKDIEDFIYRCYRDANSHEGLLTNINDFRVKIKTI